MTEMNLAELATALAKAQGAIEGAAKDTENPFFKSKYADLGAVWAACRKPLSDNGLSVMQMPRVLDGGVRLVTRLLHSSGAWIEDDGMPLLASKQDMQSFGSAITYARRYGLMCAVGIAPEDDDGNAAVKDDRKAPSKAQQEANDALRKSAQIIKTSIEGAMFAVDVDNIMDSEAATLRDLTDKARSYLVKLAQDRKTALEAQ